ncbi:MAG: LysR family transcriptional regulator [Pseudomonas sp.]|uniref:LysR family transcriptional regulator n=1 Tax=Pseudomonas sp. TaxID=306 RepID=UPI003D0BC04D
MELRHLRYFVATAEAQSLTKAALALHIAQPPLGQQIRALEEEIGTPLFHRQGRGIVLSDAGKAFLVCGRDILARAEEAKGRALRAARGEIGTLTLGFTESASFNEGMTALLHLYQQRYRQVQINLVEGNSETLVGRLLERQIDAAIVRPPFAGGCDLAFQILSEEPLMVVLPDGHPLLARDRLDLADLRDERFILYSRKSGYGLSAEIVSACRAQGFSPRIHQQAPQVSSAVNLVSAGMGVALVPASMQRMARPGLNFRQLALEQPRATLGLATLAQTPSAVVDGLLQCAREVLAGG